MSGGSEFRWYRPPAEGLTADDLDRIPDLPSHAELIDGSLILVSPQRRFHMKVVRLIEGALLRSAPRDRFLVDREMSVVLGPRQRPEPDLIVVQADAAIDDDATWYPADAVVVAIEVVSPESEIRDRQRKPQLYADAGIRYFWLVESQERKPVVHVYELDQERGGYSPIGIFVDRVRLSVPFDIDIDLTEFDRL